MFVETMNMEQLVKEYSEDMRNVFAVCDARQGDVDKRVRKSRMFPMYFYKYVKSKRKNNWIILWEARNKKNVDDYSIVTFVATMDFGSSRYALLYTSYHNDPVYLFFTPHFFSRYAQRMEINLTGMELIRRYFKFNASYGFTAKTDTFYNISKLNVYGSTKEGVAMGVKLNTKENCVLFRTFITYDMTKGEQIDTFADAEKIRAEIHEKETILNI